MAGISLADELQDYADVLGRNIREARRARGLSQKDHAALAGISIPTLQSIESGNAAVSMQNYLKALEALSLASHITSVAAPHLDVRGCELRIVKSKAGKSKNTGVVVKP